MRVKSGQNVADIANTYDAHRATASSTLAPSSQDNTSLLSAIPLADWRALGARAIEPNGYFLPEWTRAVDATARGRTDVSTLTAWHDETTLIGLLPVISFRRAYGIPLPALVTADPYGTLSTPLLERDCAVDAVAQMMEQASRSGAHALVLRDVALEGPAMAAIDAALARKNLKTTILQSHARACLDATRDAEDVLREALGAKKLKELRRQRNRLAEHGEVVFEVARSIPNIEAALDVFLDLEASGWKAKRGTALKLHAGDATFIRRGTTELAAGGQCEIVSLRAGTTPIAAAIVLKHLDRAFYFKLGIDESFAKLSPGVQLTLDLTRHLCADPAIGLVDSTAMPGHPMIDPIWRGRLRIGDVLVPLRPFDPIVPLISGALSLRRGVREPLRRAFNFIRKRQEKPQ